MTKQFKDILIKLFYIMSSYTERYVPAVVDKLRNITHHQLENLFNDENNKGEELNIQNIVKGVRKLCKDARRNKYRREISYKFAKNETEGRLYSKEFSLQTCPRQIRGSLCYEFAIDVDMVCCHHSILYDICRRNKIPCDVLGTYINEREDKLMEFASEENVTRDEAKRFFIKSLNIETLVKKIDNRRNIRNEFFIEFDKCIKKIQQEIIKIYPDVYKKRQQTKSWNAIGSTISWILCCEENRILERAEVALTNDGYKIMTLCFDGLMLHKLDDEGRPVNYKRAVELLNQLTEDMNISWAEKPLDLSALDTIMDLSGEDNDLFIGYGEDEEELVEQINSFFFKGKFYRSQGDLFLLSGNTWIKNKPHIRQKVVEKIAKSYGYLVRKKEQNGVVKETYECVTRTLTGGKKFADKIMEKAEEVGDKFLTKLEEKCLGYITFNNGYWDFEKGFFKKFDDDYQTINTVNHDFQYYTPHHPLRRELMERLFYPMFCVKTENSDNFHIMENFLHLTARALAGHREDKRWFCVQGMRDSCKGVYNISMLKAFGSYIGTFNTQRLQLKKDNDEIERKQGCFLKDFSTRLLISQEIGESWLDGVLIKKLSSGGDTMVARQLYHDDTTFIPSFKIMLMGNEDVRIKPQDAMDTCWFYVMRCKFVDDPDNLPNKSRFITYYKSDGSIKDWVRREDVACCVASLLFDYYKRTDTFYPQSIKDDNTEQTEQNVNPAEAVREIFEYTGNPKDRLTTSETNEIYKSFMDIFDSPVKMRKLMKEMGGVPYNIKGTRGLKCIKRQAVAFVNMSEDEESCDDI